MIKCSLNIGRVLKQWKGADIIPIYKGEIKEEPLNYRLVSLTGIIYKLCKKVKKGKWTDFLEREKILMDREFGIRKGSLYITNLLSFYSNVINTIHRKEMDGWIAFTWV